MVVHVFRHEQGAIEASKKGGLTILCKESITRNKEHI